MRSEKFRCSSMCLYVKILLLFPKTHAQLRLLQLLVRYRLHLAPLARFLFQLAVRVVKALPQLPGERAVVAVALVGAPELADPKPDDAEKVLAQNLLAGGVLHIPENVARAEAHKVQQAEALMRVDVPECDGFAPVAVKHAARAFVMDMRDDRFGSVVDFAAGLHDAVSPIQVFQTGQSFVVGVLESEQAAHSGVGVVAESAVLVSLGGIREPAGKNLLLGVFGGLAAALLAIDQSDGGVGKGSQQLFQPVRVDRVDMGAGEDQDFPAGGLDAAVEGAPEGEFLWGDVDEPDGVALRDFHGPVGRA